MTSKVITWQPIESAPRTRRLRLWMRHGEKHGRWNNDPYAVKAARPYWDYDGERISYSRANPPTHWMDVSDGPEDVPSAHHAA